MTLRAILDSGEVRRFHTHPVLAPHADTLAAHQWQVAVIIMTLWPDASRELVRAALLHDVGEVATGDIPYLTKRANRGIAARLGDLEESTRVGFGIDPFDLDATETRMLKVADGISAYWRARLINTSVIRSGGWPEQRAEIISEAIGLGVGQQVAAVMGWHEDLAHD